MHKKLYTPNLSILSDSLWQHFENKSRYIVQEHQAENLLTELSSEMKVGRSKINEMKIKNVYELLTYETLTRLLVSRPSLECLDCLLKSMEK